jgi:uncharacterized protein YjeT (DUF2065 family)
MKEVRTMTIPSLLLALVGLVAVLSGLLLLFAPARAATTLGLGSLDQLADGYARFSGVRNLVAGALLVALAYAFGVTHVAHLTVFVAGAAAWGITQLVDAVIFLRLGSRPGALSAGALVLLLVVAMALAWTG